MRGRFIALVLYQGFPWYDEQMLKDETIATLASGGFNIVRLGAMWTGFEPEKGQINQSYVDILKVNQTGNLLGPELILVSGFGDIYSFCCLTVLPVPAWVLLNILYTVETCANGTMGWFQN